LRILKLKKNELNSKYNVHFLYVSEFLEMIATRLNKTTEEVISDGVFNQVAGIDHIMSKVFKVDEE
jgi:hypothetical protein